MILHLKPYLLRNTDMRDIFKENFDNSNVEPPKGLKKAVFDRIEKEKTNKMFREKIFLQMGFLFFGILSIVSVVIFGREILSSEFASLILLGFSDMKSIAVLWQNYTLLLLETLPTMTIAVTLSPVFIFLILLKEYGKIRSESYSFRN